MNSDNGWILPDGSYVECTYEGHIRCAEEKLGTDEKKLEKLAVKVSCLPVSTQRMVLNGSEYHPNFLTRRRRMTRRQLVTIEKYCITFGYRPPLDYFYQQGLDDMLKMSTADILSILREGGRSVVSSKRLGKKALK